MTEKRGGSDVGSSTDTLSIKEQGDQHKLFGFKWFTSAIDSEMSLALARSTKEGQAVKGSKGLNLFYVETRNKEQALNKIKVVRMKEKLGTR
jgi:alkylation response protein AidB-like acyl-CoA dehydrogenase